MLLIFFGDFLDPVKSSVHNKRSGRYFFLDTWTRNIVIKKRTFSSRWKTFLTFPLLSAYFMNKVPFAIYSLTQDFPCVELLITIWTISKENTEFTGSSGTLVSMTHYWLPEVVGHWSQCPTTSGPLMINLNLSQNLKIFLTSYIQLNNRYFLSDFKLAKISNVIQ